MSYTTCTELDSLYSEYVLYVWEGGWGGGGGGHSCFVKHSIFILCIWQLGAVGTSNL